jgi:hypothetical protein
MKCLAVCATYGRIPFLNRSVASFLSQNYDDKHLVIVNDDKNITINCDSELVTCININKKLLLDEKRNIGINLGNYDLIVGWDDDDISLPNRINHHVLKHQRHPKCQYYKNWLSYLVTDNEFKMNLLCPNDISFTKKTWFDYGGYDNFIKLNGGDVKFLNRIKNILQDRDYDEIHHIYSMGGLNYHVSSLNKINIDFEKIAYDQLNDLGIFGDVYNIVPDYTEYNKFLELDRLWKSGERNIPITHTELGKINV